MPFMSVNKFLIFPHVSSFQFTYNYVFIPLIFFTTFRLSEISSHNVCLSHSFMRDDDGSPSIQSLLLSPDDVFHLVLPTSAAFFCGVWHRHCAGEHMITSIFRFVFQVLHFRKKIRDFLSVSYESGVNDVVQTP